MKKTIFTIFAVVLCIFVSTINIFAEGKCLVDVEELDINLQISTR